ncbi:YdcF family protein [Shimazuella kribbensis]|uniref:YdcF family protein n=1 Tax=Shimazuella kribbensis TaxID=139808 RepID=UPI000412F29D|nr:YdcF family protein [Shimazuella kribbensis]
MTSNNKKIIYILSALLLIGIIFTASVLSTSATSTTTDINLTPGQNNEPTSYRIEDWKKIAMHYYWHGGDIKKAEEEIFKGVTLKGNYDVVAQAFKEAIHLDPFDTDLKISLASTQIIQKKIPDALHTYKQILNLDPNHFDANLLYGVYSKINDDEKTYQKSIAKLRTLDATKTNVYLKKFQTTEAIMKEKINTIAPSGLPQQKHAIVILGYALAEDGSMQPTLIERLKVGLSLAKKYPNSKIVVSGGVPKQGKTEASSMNDWLISQGIDKDRIVQENKSTDTVENALFSISKINELGIQDATIVTSASHIRRALTVFREASDFYDKLNQTNSKRTFTNVVYLDYPTVEEAQKVIKDEKLVIYRDLFRVSGIWQYPKLQR